MRKIYFFFLLLLFFPANLFAGNFKIVEVLPNTLDDKNLEYIDVKNISNETLSLSGYILADKKKEFLIQENIFLEPSEKYRFLRTETKIILNNSNEEIFLKNPENILVDTVEYPSSSKGYPLYFPEENSLEIVDENIISEEIYISGEVYISDEVEISSSKDGENSPSSDTDSIIQNNEKNETRWNQGIVAPEIIFTLQRPSYITQSGSTDMYICDTQKDECKINFDLRENFSDAFPKRDYECEIDFGMGSGSITGEEEKCNPNTVIFPQGEFEVIFSIFHEDNREIFSKKKIQIIHEEGISTSDMVLSEQNNSSGVQNNDSPSSDTDSIIQNNEENETQGSWEIVAPEITFTLQRPSYITQSGSTDMYICDTQKDECKVNFDLRESFSQDFSPSDYICEINFGMGSGSITGEEEKCNPNTVVFPQGEFEVIFSIFHEDNREIFSEKKIIILHNKSVSSSSEKSGIYIASPKIRVQSGLSGGGRYFYCKKLECKINLNYKKRHDDERCEWNFRGGEKSSKNTDKRCNPGYVTFPEGIFELSLRVYEKDNEQNYKKKIFYVYNEAEQYEETKQGEEKEILVWKNQENGESVETQYFASESLASLEKVEIILQGKISSEKSFTGNILECKNVEKCYVNLTSSGGILREDISYLWSQNGEKFSEKQNPKGIWLMGIGNHEIDLKIYAGEKIIGKQKFYVNISSGEVEQGGNSSSGKNTQKNTKENDLATLNFLPLKYDGLRISGKYIPNKKIDIFVGESYLGDVLTDEKGKYRFVTKNISAGEYNFVLKDGGKILAEKSFLLLGKKRAYWFVGKKSASTKQSSSSYTPKIPSLKIQSIDAVRDEVSQPELTFFQKIFFILLLSLCLAFTILHMMFLQFSGTPKIFHPQIFLEQFRIKQKILLTL